LVYRSASNSLDPKKNNNNNKEEENRHGCGHPTTTTYTYCVHNNIRRRRSLEKEY
jgi:hypothetical protein